MTPACNAVAEVSETKSENQGSWQIRDFWSRLCTRAKKEDTDSRPEGLKLAATPRHLVRKTEGIHVGLQQIP